MGKGRTGPAFDRLLTRLGAAARETRKARLAERAKSYWRKRDLPQLVDRDTLHAIVDPACLSRQAAIDLLRAELRAARREPAWQRAGHAARRIRALIIALLGENERTSSR